MFQPTIELFERYCEKLRSNKSIPVNEGLVGEVRERLWQLSYLVRKIRESERKQVEVALHRLPFRLNDRGELVARPASAETLKPGVQPQDIASERQSAMSEASRVLAVYVDAFYWAAWRLRQIVRLLPGLKRFEPVGVRTVRNHLVEHPEGSGIYTLSSAGDNVRGMRLRPTRIGEEPADPQDPGLWPNAEELRDKLGALLQRNLNS